MESYGCISVTASLCLATWTTLLSRLNLFMPTSNPNFRYFDDSDGFFLFIQVIVNRKEYFYDLNNYIEWAMYTCAIVYVIQLDDQKSNLQRAAGAIALTLSWINFVWFLKMFSLFGIYIIMAEKVFITICKVSFVEL